MKTRFLAGFALTFLAACLPPVPEPTPTIERAPSLAPSPTVLPIIIPESDNNFIGRSDPTAAALAAEGQPDQEAEIIPFPTEVTIPMTIIADDGVILRADFYGAQQHPAPGVMLLPGESGITDDLMLAAQNLQIAGYHTMLLHLRGYGASGGKIDLSWT
ncbi:MAG TPA: hypothetical protein VJZ27_17815, partial [Aggregatilineales bacterium]|nr:hypothetical protein [Aggregatilineales bacterium]